MRIWLTLATLLAATPALAQRPASGSPGLSSFANDAELRAFLRRVARDRQVVMPPPMIVPAPPPPPPVVEAPAAPTSKGFSAASDNIVVSAFRKASPDAITNTQVAGVDEGGIVKLSGETLVILRRGRLHTVSLAGGVMRPIASVEAFPPGVDGSGDWYDEMLLAGDRVMVIGYSYRRGGTEVNRFRLGRDGSLRFEDSTALRSNDYYSSRNYASRLIGSTLIYYAPLDLDLEADDPLAALPAVRRWQRGVKDGAWRRVTPASRVFIPARLRRARGLNLHTAHSVTTCDLTAPVLDCAGTVVLGTESRTFFVSANAVYVWTGGVLEKPRARVANGLLYRLPFDRMQRPQAVGVRGSPIDQFSFGPDDRRGALNVVVAADGNGDAMWRPEASEGELALVRIPMTLFGGGEREVPLARYQPLPSTELYAVQNRFVGDHLLYGGTNYSDDEGDDRINVVALETGRVTTIPMPHATSRLDLMGADGIVIGEGNGGLGFSTIALDATPRRADTFTLATAREGENRSHAFFFRADAADGSSGLLGLPVARARTQGTRFLGNSAAIQFLRRANRRLAQAGELAAQGTAGETRDDGCVASCVDWYGNARPIFWRGRVFALMGYELVEGREARGGVREAARVSFAPGKR